MLLKPPGDRIDRDSDASLDRREVVRDMGIVLISLLGISSKQLLNASLVEGTQDCSTLSDSKRGGLSLDDRAAEGSLCKVDECIKYSSYYKYLFESIAKT